MTEETQSGEIKTPLGSVSFSGKKTAEVIAILSLCLLFLLAWVLWEHKADAKGHGDSLTSVMKDMAQAIREGNCINSYPEAERESKIEMCKRITR